MNFSMKENTFLMKKSKEIRRMKSLPSKKTYKSQPSLKNSKTWSITSRKINELLRQSNFNYNESKNKVSTRKNLTFS